VQRLSSSYPNKSFPSRSQIECCGEINPRVGDPLKSAFFISLSTQSEGCSGIKTWSGAQSLLPRITRHAPVKLSVSKDCELKFSRWSQWLKNRHRCKPERVTIISAFPPAGERAQFERWVRRRRSFFISSAREVGLDPYPPLLLRARVGLCVLSEILTPLLGVLKGSRRAVLEEPNGIGRNSGHWIILLHSSR
jgi:hypothetical protein